MKSTNGPCKLARIIVLFLLQSLVESFSIKANSLTQQVHTSNYATTLHATNDKLLHTRRDALLGCVLFGSTIIANSPSVALAATIDASQLAIDKQKILAGYKRLNYLLDNWISETTVCGKRGSEDRFDSGCDRTPEKVMEYLGYKSMNDPLFKAEKRLLRLSTLVLDDNDSERYQEALETFMEKADEGTGMAFVSSWGEANPGGGKDRVELFIERSKNNVIEVRDSLKTILDILGYL